MRYFGFFFLILVARPHLVLCEPSRCCVKMKSREKVPLLFFFLFSLDVPSMPVVVGK